MKVKTLIKLLVDLDTGGDVEVLAGLSVDNAGTVTGLWTTGDGNGNPVVVLSVPEKK